MSSRQDILESRIFQDFLKSGVLLLRDINSLHSYKSRQRRSLLGMVKGHSDDSEEAQVRSHDHHVMSSLRSCDLVPTATTETSNGECVELVLEHNTPTALSESKHTHW